VAGEDSGSKVTVASTSAGGRSRPTPAACAVCYRRVCALSARFPQHNREVCGQPWSHCIVPSPAHIVTGLVYTSGGLWNMRGPQSFDRFPRVSLSRAAAGFLPGVERALPFPDRQPVTTTGGVRRPPASPDYASSRGRLLI
jgi:hypothetical protein